MKKTIYRHKFKTELIGFGDLLDMPDEKECKGNWDKSCATTKRILRIQKSGFCLLVKMEIER